MLHQKYAKIKLCIEPSPTITEVDRLTEGRRCLRPIRVLHSAAAQMWSETPQQSHRTIIFQWKSPISIGKKEIFDISVFLQ